MRIFIGSLIAIFIVTIICVDRTSQCPPRIPPQGPDQPPCRLPPSVKGAPGCKWPPKPRRKTRRSEDAIPDLHVRPSGNVRDDKGNFLDILMASGQNDKLADRNKHPKPLSDPQSRREILPIGSKNMK